MQRRLAFVWENFGPIHADRCEALANRYSGLHEVVGIELAGTSDTYEWRSESGAGFRKITLFPNVKLSQVGGLKRFWRTLRVCLSERADTIFLCHYEHVATFLAASVLRVLGRTTIVMNDSKYDDYDRYLWREVGKSIAYLPYWGAMASGKRSKDYLRFLGVRADRIATNYNALSLARVRRLSGSVPAPDGHPFSERHFTIVARLVPKKNLFVALNAFAKYRESVRAPRDLHVCGSGPLENELKTYASSRGLGDCVKFRGFVQTEEVCRILASTLALVLSSTEEQFGNVVIEAQAMAVPVILSDQCGARDQLVRSGVNGFIVETDNSEGFAFFMRLIAEDEALWRRLCKNAEYLSRMGDVENFVDAVDTLVKASQRA